MNEFIQRSCRFAACARSGLGGVLYLLFSNVRAENGLDVAYMLQ